MNTNAAYRVVVYVETREQQEAIVAALTAAEEEGDLDFAFNVETDTVSAE